MKIGTFLIITAAVAATSCVSLGKYEAMESNSKRYQKELLNVQQELSQLKDEHADLIRQNQALTVSMGELANAKQESDNSVARLTRELENARYRYDTMMENNLQQISGKNRDLNKANEKLLARTQELNDKEEEFRKKEAMLREQQAKLQKAEEAAKAALAAKEEALAAKQKELDQIRQSVTNALVGFADKGMQVETKDGKVYVSMDSKLMFPSASWKVSNEGNKAIKELAKVLEENADLNIVVEGHTDNDPYTGSTAVKDNWDLSVMRATAIVKLILQYGPGIDPARIEAAGHGPYMPKVENSSKENKAMNRRTEIILTPKLSDVLQMLGE
ncbi:MAG: OmpA family protein [Bacteroidales bacterium]|nr:OmpA family protein [Bacteroidales bacterium]